MLTAIIIWQVKGKILYDLYEISAGEEPFTLEFLPRYNNFMRHVAPLEILFYTGLWCIKFSFMAFFCRLSSKVKSLRVWWFIVLFCTVAVYITSVADIEYACSFRGIEFIISEKDSNQIYSVTDMLIYRISSSVPPAQTCSLRESNLLGQCCRRCDHRSDE
jgi:hypothetical protein